MSDRSEQAYLGDVVEACERIRSYIQNMTYDQFLNDTKTQDAVLRNIEIIGEAVKQLPDSLTEKHPAIPWNQAARMRDRLIHHYFGVNLDVVWSVVEADLPKLLDQIKSILA
jgi:uncharacterized protein with HEPN domain